jgi:NAD(P)-dependent dehydrogenase (short-subunit alcohol dehydrogenase family)
MATGTVLVTGASTGIGQATVLHLKTLGFDAIGAVRKDEDAERLGRAGSARSASTSPTPARSRPPVSSSATSPLRAL